MGKESNLGVADPGNTEGMFSILFVCSGNRCRSPYAHAVAAALSPDWVEVSSAGTLDIPGARPPAELLAVAEDHNVDLSAFRSVPLAEANPQGADLIVGMTLDHVASGVVNGGANPEKSFTITELVRLLELSRPKPTHSPEEAAEVVTRAHATRVQQKTFVPAGDIEDPMGGPRKAYEAMANRLDGLCRRMVSGMGWG